MSENPILCFQHCQPGISIYCISMPSVCSVCAQSLVKSQLRIPPYRPVSPFVSSKDTPYSVVIKPTFGTFLIDYVNGCDLHVGVTDSYGTVYDFDSFGVSRSIHGWNQCLALEIADYLDEQKSSLWNLNLQEFTSYEQWMPEKYSEESNNCYNFALEFLRLMNLYESIQSIVSKSEFCKEMVLPQTIRAAKYISLYRRILLKRIVVSYSEEEIVH